jgi:multicomponent Na+:H+ antiporter subunit B
VAVAIVRTRNLFSAVALGGIYSFCMALALLVLDAPDVSMTEAAVGAGVSTVLFLGSLYLTRIAETPGRGIAVIPLLVSVVAGSALLYGAWALPPFGDPAGPIHRHVAPRYLNEVVKETGVPNAVTAVLASYRGFDTFGETVVVLTGGLGVLLLLRGRRRPAMNTVERNGKDPA